MVCFWWKSGVKEGIIGKSGTGRLEIASHAIEKSDNGLLVTLKENPMPDAVWPSGSRFVAAIDNGAGKDSANARTAGTSNFVFFVYFIKKTEWHSPRVCEELQSYFARWRVKTGLTVR